MNTEKLWENFLSIIKTRISKISFDTWFADTILYELKDNKAIVIVKMHMQKKQLKENYNDLIEEIFTEISGSNFKFEYLLEEEIEDNIKIDIEENNEDIFETNLNPKYTFDNFIVGESNKFAQSTALTVAENPGQMYNPLFIYANSGLGKTHLMHAIGNYIVQNKHKRVLYVTCEKFVEDFIGVTRKKQNNNFDNVELFKRKYRDIDVLIIDDIQYLGNANQTQQEFFNTFNALHKAGKQIIISSDKSPDDLKKIEERLRSRFMWGLPVDIYPPDFDLRCRIIRNKIANTSIADKIDEKVIEYIANSCQNDVRHIEGTINRLMAYTAMIVPEKIDLEFAYEALKDFITTNIYSASSIEKIQKAVASYYGITIDDLKGKKRSNKVAYQR